METGRNSTSRFGDEVADLVCLDDRELDALNRQYELDQRLLTGRRAAVLSVIEQRKTYRLDGNRTLGAYLRASTHSSRSDVARYRKLVELFNVAPSVADAVMEGHLPVDHALEIERVRANPRIAHTLPSIVELLIEEGEQLEYDDFKLFVTQYISLADQDGAFDAEQHAIQHRNARVDDIEGVLSITADGGDAVTATRLAMIFTEFVRAEYNTDLTARVAEHGESATDIPLARTAAQRRFDALVRIFDTAAAAEVPGVAAPPVVNIVIDENSFMDQFIRHGLLEPLNLDADTNQQLLTALVDRVNADPDVIFERRCHTDTGAIVPPGAALQAALAGHVRRVVINSQGVIINMGTKQRLFTGAARTAAKLLHRRCSQPGCRVSVIDTETDHIHPWASGGRTDQANAAQRCRGDNLVKEQLGLTTIRDSRGRRVHHPPRRLGHARRRTTTPTRTRPHRRTPNPRHPTTQEPPHLGRLNGRRATSTVFGLIVAPHVCRSLVAPVGVLPSVCWTGKIAIV